MPNYRILLIDDDALLVQSLSGQLERERYIVVTEATAEKGLERAKSESFDAICLDVGLPDGNGIDVCSSLRRSGVNTPIIMLTGFDSDQDTILGLSAGASDYIAKPFRFSVLLARIRAQVRQHHQYDDVAINMGPYTFRPADKYLTVGDGRRIRLTDKEVAILKHLCRTEGVVSREELLDVVWGFDAGISTHTLETHIYRLRQKIDPLKDGRRMLITEPGGYRLNDGENHMSCRGE
ncbi:response regulator transcription factor [Sedimenticola thiotaurini]|uniref:Transcriptional regulator n=1 Tax=Sedimenticola thiotaurini TaxID=1543721 RepID=A0A0F7JZI1_9GAMM|nr:response regulator transcription factor [Sedimenticola thiotaurini]AKH20375.1 transcriptional regulator [Sedimenticola thiotaurini]